MRISDKRGIDGTERKYKAFPEQVSMEAKTLLIMQDIAKGETYNTISKKYAKEWGLSETTIRNTITEVLKYMRSEETKQNIISMNMERLDNIISSSMKQFDNKNAIKAIDTQNKMCGAYVEKVEIDADNEINLIFDIGE